MKLEEIAEDDILQGWHDAGASKGMEPLYFRVLKVARVKVRVRCETGGEGWMYPEAFSKKMRPDQVDFVIWRT